MEYAIAKIKIGLFPVGLICWLGNFYDSISIQAKGFKISH
jgi:hypothetical protein